MACLINSVSIFSELNEIFFKNNFVIFFEFIELAFFKSRFFESISILSNIS